MLLPLSLDGFLKVALQFARRLFDAIASALLQTIAEFVETHLDFLVERIHRRAGHGAELLFRLVGKGLPCGFQILLQRPPRFGQILLKFLRRGSEELLRSFVEVL